MTAPNATKPLHEVTVTVDGVTWTRCDRFPKSDGWYSPDPTTAVYSYAWSGTTQASSFERIAELEAQKAVLLAACRAAWPSHQSRYDRVGEQLWAAIERAEGHTQRHAF